MSNNSANLLPSVATFRTSALCQNPFVADQTGQAGYSILDPAFDARPVADRFHEDVEVDEI